MLVTVDNSIQESCHTLCKPGASHVTIKVVNFDKEWHKVWDIPCIQPSGSKSFTVVAAKVRYSSLCLIQVATGLTPAQLTVGNLLHCECPAWLLFMQMHRNLALCCAARMWEDQQDTGSCQPFLPTLICSQCPFNSQLQVNFGTPRYFEAFESWCKHCCTQKKGSTAHPKRTHWCGYCTSNRHWWTYFKFNSIWSDMQKNSSSASVLQ